MHDPAIIGSDEPARLSPTARSAFESDVDPSYRRILLAMLRNRYLVLRIAALGAVTGAAIALLSPREYSSDFSFVPQSESGGGGLSAIASGFGLNLGATGSQSPVFYVDLVKTRKVLDELLDAKYEFESSTGKVQRTLLEHLAPKGKSPERRRVAAMQMLTDEISARSDLKTGVVTIGVRASSPQLAAQVANRMIAAINTFDVQSRRSQTLAERDFAQTKMAEAAVELRQAEDRAQAFGERNRNTGSPELLREKLRIDRQIALKANEYEQLVLAYDRARLEAVRETPVITMIDKPEVPVLPDSRGGVLKLLGGMILAAAAALLFVFTREALREQETTPAEDAIEIEEEAAETRADLRRPMRFIRRFFFGARPDDDSRDALASARRAQKAVLEPQ